MKKRTSLIVTPVTPDQFETALSQYASAENRESAILSGIDKEINRLHNCHAEECTMLAREKKEALKILQAYCTENKKALFSKKRSIETLYGTLGFRLGTPKLKTLKGFTWDRVLEKIKEKLPVYLRTTEETAKDLLLADRNKAAVASLLPELGLQVVQEELFFVELKKQQPQMAH